MNIPSSELQALTQRAVGKQILKYLHIVDRWSCLQVFPTWRGLEATPVILAEGSERNRLKITNERGFGLVVEILNTLRFTGSMSLNLVSMDLRAIVLSINDLSDLLSGPKVVVFEHLESVSATLQQTHFFPTESHTSWIGNTPILTDPILPLPRLKSLDILIIPKLSINSTPLAKLLRLALTASSITLRDRDSSSPSYGAQHFSWYTRHNFPQSYPNLKHLSASIHTEFLTAMLMETRGDYKTWFPVLEKLTLFDQSNYMKRQDLEEYRDIFKGVVVEVPPHTRFLDWV
ncbi:hypothetical protein TcWFU_002944 [Taenia crassiceps]|uniref:Uncharacterized protein n=1 Tax=Taenia crassiceps TaxID=6207 RepID=A0ABR4QK28_9CEST